MNHQRPSEVTVALVQMACGPTKDRNVEKALSRIKDAADNGAGMEKVSGTVF